MKIKETRLLIGMAIMMMAVVSIEGRGNARFPPMPDPCSNGFNPNQQWAEDGFVLLVLTWPGAFCSSGPIPQERCPLTLDPTPNFTIHGLWPNNVGKGYPSCCEVTATSQSLLQDLAKPQNKDLAARVAKRWPELGKTGFLAYEYNKHGTCALDWFQTPLNFVKATLDAADKFDFIGALGLSDNQLETGVELKFAELQSRLRSAVNKNVKVACDRQGNFAEVRVCLKRALNTNLATQLPSLVPFDCPTTILKDGPRCRSDTPVLNWPLPLSNDNRNDDTNDDSVHNLSDDDIPL